MAHKHFANAGPSQDAESKRISPCGAGESSPMVRSRQSERSGARRKQSGSIERTLNSAGVMEPTVKTSSARVRMGSFEVDLRSGELHSLGSDGVANKAAAQGAALPGSADARRTGGKIVTRSEIKKGSGSMTPSWTTIPSSMSRFGRGEVTIGNSRTVLATCFRIGNGDARFHWLENRSESPL